MPPMGYIKGEIVYFYSVAKGEFVPICKVEDLKEINLMETDKDIEFFNKLKVYEETKYIRIPFTKRRLIFRGGRYAGWYRFK